MSIRAVGTRLFKHGTSYIRILWQRNLNTTKIADTINVTNQLPATPSHIQRSHVLPRYFALRNVGLQLGQQARRLLINNVLNRVTNSLAAELRKKAARRILYGDSGPFFALVGVSLASGTGILTKEEELEGVCWEIREAISKINWQYLDVDIDEKNFENSQITLNDLSFGKPIAKGSNAVVYSAKVKNSTTDEQKVENLTTGDQKASKPTKIKTESEDDTTKFPLALKMLFNYDIQSNSMALLKAMYRETVPARIYYSIVGVSDWELDLSTRKRHLPPHPNVVAMFSVFTDYIPELENCRTLYPAALPERIYSDGNGRNMSLFLLMKRYNSTLQEYLEKTPCSVRKSILLFTQLLEGVAHLTSNGIAHRDLKSDNLLLDTSEPEVPILVVTDFGCCLSDRKNGLMLPFTSYDVDKGGNTALMAPEIILQKPGTFSVLDYSKSDLWAAGTIAYEIFAGYNPFYENLNFGKLRNVNYNNKDLPELPDEVPVIFRKLIKNILKRNPRQRLDPDTAANICQIYLWAPSSWIKSGLDKLPSNTEILQWLLNLATKLLCERTLTDRSRDLSKENITMESESTSSNKRDENVLRKSCRRTYPEYLLISSFLCRAKIINIRTALSWIQTNI